MTYPSRALPTGSRLLEKSVINLEDAADWHAHVERLLSEVHPFQQDLARLCGAYYAELACILYLAGDERPEIHFTPQQLRKLADLHAHIDVDLYLLG